MFVQLQQTFGTTCFMLLLYGYELQEMYANNNYDSLRYCIVWFIGEPKLSIISIKVILSSDSDLTIDIVYGKLLIMIMDFET